MLLNKRLPPSYIVNKVRIEMAYVFVIALAVYYAPIRFRMPNIPFNIPTFLGTAISVLLSFKLSQSYDRWWEARKIWGSIVNDSRNLVLQLKSVVKPGNDEMIKRMTLRQIGWCYSLGNSLRGTDPFAGMGDYLSVNDMNVLKEHKNVPLGILDLNNDDIAALREKGQIGEFSHMHLNTLIINLCNYMGMAERIKSTVFPVTYRIFLHSAIYLFIVTLSIALRGLQSYFEIPLLMIIAALFFLLEWTATHMQDPFSDKPTDTAVTAIATTIEINLKQLMNLDNVPQPAESDTFYLK